MKLPPAMANWCLNATSSVKFVVNAGCGVNALSGLQKHADSIYCRINVGLIRRASVASGAECRIVTRHLSFSGDVCLDHDRRDDHEELSYGGAAVAAVRVGASDCLAIHNVVSTSRGRAQ
ncbi:enterobactin synthase multienzyme complex phosphopantetheinyltransferase [Escherichia coli]|nr:enterobactin synthase multienzyme complex phosphopantetheinyltransferase [Escherichia coli]